MVNDIILYVWKSFKASLKETGVAIGAVSLGVATVIVLLSIGFGLYDTVNQQVSFSGASILTISASGGFGPPGTDDVNPLSQDLVDIVERVKGVDIAAGRLLRTSSIERDGESSSVFIVSLPEDTAKKTFVKDTFNYEIRRGRSLVSGTSGVLVGSELYRDTDAPYRLRETIMIENQSVRVVGLLEEAESFRVDNAFVMLQSEMESLFDVENTFDIIIAKPSSPAQIDVVKERVEEELRNERDVELGSEDFDVQTSEETVSQLQTILSIIIAFVASIGGISIVLGGLTMANTLFTVVAERSYQIGIMKSFGASSKQIKRMFILESGLIGFFAGILGLLLGVILTPILVSFAVNTLEVSLVSYRFSVTLLVLTPVISTLIGIISGYIPARNASEKDPVEVIG